jgi:CHRD domain
MPKPLFVVIFVALGVGVSVVACNDSGSSNSSPTPPAPPPPNTVDLTTELTALQVVGGGVPSGTATANLTVNVDDRSVTGSVTVTELDPTGITLKYGFAGEQGSEVIALEMDSPQQWLIPANTDLSETDFDRLNTGGIYVDVSTAANPGGALRGQLLLNNIEVYTVQLSALQQVPPITSDASAIGFVTFDSDTNNIIVHVNGVALDDANMAHVHQAIAGLNGPMLITLTQDPESISHWLAEDASLDADGLAALFAGKLYLNIHTPTNLGGEVRGQIVPSGVEVTLTQLSSDQVVISGADTMAYSVAATTVISESRNTTFHVNTVDLDDATGVSVNQAPTGQNGPSIFTLSQDSVDIFRWSAENLILSQAQIAAMRSQGLYFTVATPDFPSGKVRGQLTPENSMAGGLDTLQVTNITPAAATELAAFPTTIDITFNRELLTDTINNNVVAISASGGDGSFGDGNESPVMGFAVSASAAELTVDLTGIVVEDDVFQIGLQNNQITDLEGAILDGNADGNPGGQFLSAFSVVSPPSNANFTFIQNNVFTPSCTFSGCHSGASPAAGQNLTAGQAFANIVGVPSTQSPSLNRIEPFDPDNSYLIRKIEGNAGNRMPLGRDPLSPDIINTLRQWITEGAQNN